MTILNGYATLAQFKALPNITSIKPVDDSVIEDLISRASRAIDTYCGGRTFFARTATRYFDMPRDRQLDLDDDLLSVTALTNGDGSTVSASDYILIDRNNPPYSAIRLKQTANTIWLPDASANTEQVVAVAGSWGFVDQASSDPRSVEVIRNVEEACLWIALSAYNKRYGGQIQGVTQITGAGVVITPQGIPAEAKQLIDAYARRH